NILRFTTINPATVSSPVPNLNTLIELQLKNNFANYLIAGSQLTYDGTKVTITDTKANLDAISDQVTQLGDQPGVVVATGPALPASTGNALPALAGATSTAAKTELDVKKYDDEVPHLGNQFLLVATVIICFGILVGPLNLFWFCRGARRPHLLWVTPLLAIATSVAIIAFILLAEGIGGRGVFFRITQLLPPAVDREFAVESEVETSVTGVLTHRDFEFKYPAWVLDFRESNGNGDWDHGDFMQSGPHYTGDWFVSRREQTMVANAVVPSRAVLHLVSAATKSKGPILSSEYNDWMQNLFYLDADGNYWKLDKISDGKPTEMQNATVEEFKAAWDENLRSAPDSLSDYLRKLTPRPGMFFALGNGSSPVLEPEFAGLHWSRFRHVIVGPVIP
ncbi:MAG TPA: hypothetical protein VK737_08425, partial [Opitutales bacterium]|nr:hypothetical protein [Opitutales bacterium]